MKILHTVQLYHPHVGGSEEVVRQISERLAMRGHDVTVATSFDAQRNYQMLNNVEIKQFRISGNSVTGIEGPDQGAYVDFVLKGEFDVVMNYSAQIWSTDLLFPYLNKIKCRKVLVPLGYSALDNPKYRDYFERLPNYLRIYDRLIYMSMSYRDKIFGDDHGLSNYVIITNGADEIEFMKDSKGFKQRYGINTKHMLLSVANFYREKGHKLVIDAFKKINRKDTSLALIGNPVEGKWKWRQRYYLELKFEALRNRGVMIFERVPRPWVVSAFQEADLFVFGSQVECSPLVIYEAMAAGTPFVTTDCGDVKDRQEFGILVSDSRDMATAINSLLDDKERRTSIGSAAREYWLQNLTWEAIANQYESLYEALVSGDPGVEH